MSLASLLRNKFLEKKPSSAGEIGKLFETAAHYSRNARVKGLESTARFVLAYSAVLELSTIVLRASGYRTRGVGHHENTFKALAEIFGAEGKRLAKYLDDCREKRNSIQYDHWIDVPETETDELLEEIAKFEKGIRAWIAANHPTLIPPATPPAGGPPTSSPGRP